MKEKRRGQKRTRVTGEKRREKRGEEEEREKRKRGRGGGEMGWWGSGYVWGHCVSTEQSLPHIYGNYTIVLAELTQLVAPGKPELEQKKEKL